MELISIYFKGLRFKLWNLSFSFTSGVPGDQRVQQKVLCKLFRSTNTYTLPDPPDILSLSQ